MKAKNTHTTKKYAICCIEQARDDALDRVCDGGTEPELGEFKLKAVKRGSAEYKTTANIKRAVNKVMKSPYGGYGCTTVKVTDLVETPYEYTEAYDAWQKNKPRRDKKIGLITAAYDEAEKTIMLGGSDTLMAKAIEKMEKQLGRIS